MSQICADSPLFASIVNLPDVWQRTPVAILTPSEIPRVIRASPGMFHKKTGQNDCIDVDPRPFQRDKLARHAHRSTASRGSGAAPFRRTAARQGTGQSPFRALRGTWQSVRRSPFSHPATHDSSLVDPSSRFPRHMAKSAHRSPSRTLRHMAIGSSIPFAHSTAYGNRLVDPLSSAHDNRLVDPSSHTLQHMAIGSLIPFPRHTTIGSSIPFAHSTAHGNRLVDPPCALYGIWQSAR